MLQALPTEAPCLDCQERQFEDGNPDARCEAHTVAAAPVYERTTLEKWGPQLPIGVLQGNPGALGKSFALGEFHYEREREIDKLRNKQGGAGTHPGRTVTTVLAHMLTEWAGENWQHKQAKHRESAINNAYMEDVLYAWVYFRAMELDHILAFKTECVMRSCGHEWEWKGDLRGIELSVTREPIQPIPFELSKPLRWLKEDYDTLMLMPPKWLAMTLIKPGGSVSDIKGELALSSVYSLAKSDDPNAEPIAMNTRALDYLHKRDIERLVRAVMELFPSMDSSFEVKCPSCGHAYDTPLEWTWDFFFGSSSLSATSTR